LMAASSTSSVDFFFNLNLFPPPSTPKTPHQRQHEIVPVPLIDAIAGLRRGSTVRCLKTLLRSKLLHHDSVSYDGYRLTTLGFDYLALRALVLGGHIAAVGRRLGVGKESDVYEVLLGENGGKSLGGESGIGGRGKLGGGGRRFRSSNDDNEGEGTNNSSEAPDSFEAAMSQGRVAALKLHRLGRTSFRAVASKRDYLGKRTQYSWLSLSRLAAHREHAFMSALFEAGFPVPKPYAVSRHAVLMELVPGVPLSSVSRGEGLRDPARAYASAVGLAESLAARGLVHCDLNEFNLIVGRPTQAEHEWRVRERWERRRKRKERKQKEKKEQGGEETVKDDDDDGFASASETDSDSEEEECLTLIDFPQMVSTDHANARSLFDRDGACLVRFFSSKLGYDPAGDELWMKNRRSAAADFDASLAAGRGEQLLSSPSAAAAAAAAAAVAVEHEGEEEDDEEEEGGEEDGREVEEEARPPSLLLLSSGSNLGVATRASGFKPKRRKNGRNDDEEELDRFLDGREQGRGGGGGGGEGEGAEEGSSGGSSSEEDDESDDDESGSEESARSASDEEEEPVAALSKGISSLLVPPTPVAKEKKAAAGGGAAGEEEEEEEEEELNDEEGEELAEATLAARAAAVKARVAAEARSAAARRAASQASRGARKATSRDKRRATAGAGKGF
jgi:RIO kinase 2